MGFRSEEKVSTPKGRIAPDNLPPSYLLSAGYDGKQEKAFLRLYEPKSRQIYLWYDNTSHLSYAISKQTPEQLRSNHRLMDYPGFLTLERVEKFDALADERSIVTKVVATNPLAIGGGTRGGIRNIIGETWESRIRYYQNYIYDRSLIPGMPYRVEAGNLIQMDYELPEEVRAEMQKAFADEDPEYTENMLEWASLLQCPVPVIRRVAVDIEVHTSVVNRLPNPEEATEPITAVSFTASDGLRRVILLNETGEEATLPEIEDAEVKFYENEKSLMAEVFRVLDEYPVVLTFNGDNFDLRYMMNRAKNLAFSNDEIPITVGRRFAYLRNGLHIDLYRFFMNNAIRVYAFGNRYRQNTLDAVSGGVTGRIKIPVGAINDLTFEELARYCLNDADITFGLTSFNGDLAMQLMVIMSRISKQTMEDLTRMGVSRWILALMEWKHRKMGWLIPNAQDILLSKGGTTTTAMIKGKKYQGGIVQDPKPGVHFEVTVLDFASLYPSAIKNWNLSYETLLCSHEDCKDNLVPETNHWVCTHKKGMTSLIIGSLKDLRVLRYKPLAKDKRLPLEERTYYDVIQSALKVFLNASYGVFGAESFPLYCPPLAESTAAVGRYAMTRAIEKAQSLGIDVLYGDTDSVFLAHPTREQIDELTDWTDKELGIDLEIDKEYRYAIFSKRKKNYLGVFRDGGVDIKGLTGKKRHIPPLLKNAFMELTKILGEVETREEMPEAKKDIKDIVVSVYTKLKNRDFDLNEIAFQVMLGRRISAYETNPQHVKAARMLLDQGIQIDIGDIIRYVITTKDVKPVQMASNRDIDINKYVDHLESMFKQLLDALDMDFDTMVGRPKQTSLGRFFGS
ncbi:MAG: DNA-directed DNA polymerase I [Candidatus Bathyarchaeota archaeon]|jgi:DNA polymerase I|nr:DNA-directed DNA polymerase I [Candidatus Bathyarchaeota archaeon]